MSVGMKSAVVAQGQFYRRPLPSCCISFCSDEGKTLFREALLAGHMETYFALASQFCTQEEPAFCGLSTLVMVLNALEVDPKKAWKGPWRWYHEQMLDCCVPIEVIEKSGITFDQFACLAICNTLDVHTYRADSSSSEQQFRDLVAAKSRSADQVVVVSYSRRAIQQTGDGHFSPLGGYHPGRDLVLIFDVARFKYPPHWISLSMLYEAMKCIDNTTGLARGYMLLMKSSSLPTILFRFCPQFSVTCATRSANVMTTDVLRCVDAWQKILDEPCSDETTADSQELLRWSLNRLLDTLSSYGHQVILLTKQVESAEGISEEHKQAVSDLLRVLESLPLFSLVKQVIACHSSSSNETLLLSESRSLVDGNSIIVDSNGIHGNDGIVDGNDIHSNDGVNSTTAPYVLMQAHYLTMLVLLWPYPAAGHGARLRQIVGLQLEMCRGSDNMLLYNEVRQLRQQLKSVLGYVTSCCDCPCKARCDQVQAF